MKSKELIYLASTAILLAATANVVQAEENAPTTTDPEVAKAELQVEKDHQPQQVALPEEVSTDRQVKQESSAVKSEASTVYKAPENLAAAASLVKENVPENKASEQAKSAASEEIQNPVKAEQTSPAISASPASKKGSTSFYNAASSAGQTARGNSQAEIKGSTFVDVSSHNGHISVEDYRQLASKGVGGVVVKLTEGTHYTNPYAESQVRNAQSAGLQVSTYAFSHYTSDAEARAEARYYAAFANKLSLPKNTIMVNDMEDPKMQSGINQHTQAWADEMRKQGYANLMYYTSASWVDQNNLRHKGSINTSLFGLDNFWIAQYPAPKLSANDAKSLKYNSRAGAWQFTSQAQLLSGKHVFDQSIDYSGRFTARATLVKQPLTGKISIQNNNPKTGTFDVVVSEVSAPHGVQEVKLPTWSSERGQDDIVWYTATKQANGTYKLTVNSANHKGSMGEYNVHLYYVQGDGKLVGVGGTTTKVSLASVAKPEGKLTIANNNPKTGTFDVIVSEVSSPQGVREVLLPTWSNEQGQDDIIWHKAQKQSDGTYKFTVRASEHKNSVGDYSVHLYYIQNDGKLVGVGGTTTKVSVAKPEGKLTIANNNPKTGTFDVIVSEVSSPQGVREVLLPTWSNDQGQDDIIWHKAQKQSDGTYKFTVRSSEHKNSVGDYSVHLYYVQGDGKLVGVGGTTTKVSVAKPEGKLTIANNNPKTGTFDVIVSEVSSPQGVREVLLPTWSHEQDQDDIIWHKAQRQSDGTYKFTVRSSEHKNSVGDYSVHLYYIQNDGKMVGVGGTTTKVSLASVAKPEGKLTIANNDPKTGTFDVIVSEVSSPQGVREVLLPTWSNEQDQDDIIWHKAQKQSDGTYKFTVRASEHKNSVGDYSVHLYYVQNDGKLVGVGGTTTKVSIATGEKPQGKISIQNKNNETGEFDIVVSGVVAPEGVKTVYLPTWSSQNGQDDIQWYAAERQADGTYRKHVYARDHKNSQGEYNVHLYYLNNRNQLQGAGGEKTTISIKHPQSPSSQRDRVLAAAAAMVGVKGGSAEHHRLVNDYNSVRPLPVGYAVKNSDDWCDIFTTVIFQREGLSDLIGRECGVERHIHIFKRLGIWNEDGNSTPKAGDIITFNWDKDTQQNDGWADHIGIVEKVENGIIHTIEGNSNNVVKRNTYRIGHGNIRGFATPRYR